MVKQQLLVLALFACAASAVQAQGQVYVCTDESGRREYRNTGETRGCRRVDLPGLTTVPAPPPRAAVAAAKPAASAPEGFPRVDGPAQRARDNERRRILENELRDEERKLVELKSEYNNGEPERRGDERNYAKYQARVATLQEDINRAERNVEALKRELSKLK